MPFDLVAVQYFSLPSPLINHVSQNCSTFLYWKLIKTCKHFFSRYAVGMNDEVNDIVRNGDSSPLFDLYNSLTLFSRPRVFTISEFQAWEKLIWDVRCISLGFQNLLSKIYRLGVRTLILNDITILYSDLAMFLRDNEVEVLYLQRFNSLQSDGIKATIEEFLFLVPHLVQLVYKSNKYDKITFKSKSVTLKRSSLPKLVFVSLKNLDDSFDYYQICKYLKKIKDISFLCIFRKASRRYAEAAKIIFLHYFYIPKKPRAGGFGNSYNEEDTRKDMSIYFFIGPKCGLLEVLRKV